jgi:hypothetical protein
MDIRVETLYLWDFSQTSVGTNGTYREDVWGAISYTVPGSTANRAFDVVSWRGGYLFLNSQLESWR